MTAKRNRRATRPERIATLLEQARVAPHAQDFYALARALENAHPAMPRLGTSLRPADEAVRFGQDIALTFAPAPLSSVAATPGGRAVRVGVQFMGLFGPNGPLPLHLTEYAYERQLHDADRTLAAFADIFHHRMISLLYRAWAQAQPAIGLDRDDDAPFDYYVDALFGSSGEQWQDRDTITRGAKRRYCGILARGVKNAEGLRDILADYLQVPVSVEGFVGHWMPMQARDRTRLGAGSAAARLGSGAVLGDAVWDCQGKFRVLVGPLSWDDYQRFLPGGSGALAVRDWVRQYLGFGLAWDLAVGLRSAEVPPAGLGGKTRVGLSTWLGPADRARAMRADRIDLIYTPEEYRAGATTPPVKR